MLATQLPMAVNTNEVAQPAQSAARSRTRRGGQITGFAEAMNAAMERAGPNDVPEMRSRRAGSEPDHQGGELRDADGARDMPFSTDDDPEITARAALFGNAILSLFNPAAQNPAGNPEAESAHEIPAEPVLKNTAKPLPDKPDTAAAATMRNTEYSAQQRNVNDTQDVSILESQEEIGSLPAPTAQTNNIADREALARMPKTGLPDQPDNNGQQKSSETLITDPYPLENINETHSQAQTAGKQSQLTKDGDESNEPANTTKQSVFSENQLIDIAPQKVVANETMNARLNSPEPVEARNLYSEIVERVDIARGDGESEMTIQLKPEYLGRVTLKLVTGADGMQIRINADDASVKSMLDARIAALTESLEQKGVRVANVDVVYTGISGNNPNDVRRDTDNGETAQSRSRSNRRSSGSISSIDSFTEQIVEYYPIEEIDAVSVMFSA